jgi:hypothetical protein
MGRDGDEASLAGEPLLDPKLLIQMEHSERIKGMATQFARHESAIQ